MVDDRRIIHEITPLMGNDVLYCRPTQKGVYLSYP